MKLRTVWVENGRLTGAIGLEALESKFVPIHHCGDEVPAVRTRIFGTTEDHQTSIRISMYFGDESASEVSDCVKMAEYLIHGFPAYLRGECRIEVFFRVTESAFTLDAIDRGTGQVVPVDEIRADD